VNLFLNVAVVSENQIQKRPLYSVIIPTCARANVLEQLLRILSPQVDASGEIIVTDDSPSQKEAKEVVGKFSNVRIISGPRRGRASNRNCGADSAKGDWLIFVDDDVVPEGRFIQAYLQSIADGKADVLEGRTYSDENLDRERFEAPVNETGGLLWSCNFAIRRGLFDAIGGFADIFATYGCEDIELQARLADAGHVIQFVGPASVYHAPRPRPGVFQMAKRWHATWVLRLLWNERPAGLFVRLPRHIIAYGIGDALQFKSLRARAILIFHAVFVAGIVACRLPWWHLRDFRKINAFRRTRKRDQCAA